MFLRDFSWSAAALFFTLVGMVQLSCTSYKLHLDPSVRDWQSKDLPADQQPVHSVYLLGDAGGSPAQDTAAGIKLFKQHLRKAPANSSAIFLGDNIYPNGLAPPEHEAHAFGAHRIKVQLVALEAFKGRPIFIPGNHDWYRFNLAGIKRQEQFTEQYLQNSRKDGGNYFLPDKGCGGPLTVTVNEDLAFLIMDSQWYLQIGSGTDDNPACPGWNRKRFWDSLSYHCQRLADKELILVLHHPLYTNGKHGGYFSWRHHLFPLTEFKSWLWIPLPGLGSIYPLGRRLAGVRQDVRNKEYQELKHRLSSIAAAHGRSLIVGGHEHALQYFEVEGQVYIVSGAGSKQTQVRKGKGALFAYGRQGFARLDYYRDGQFWIRFFAVDKGEVFRRKIRG